MRLRSGVAGFDALIGGGFPEGTSIVLQGPPGTEKLSFALTFLAEGLKAGASGLVVISSQSPNAVLAELRNLGVDLEAVTNEHRLRIVDWYSWSEEAVHDIEERGLVLRSSIDLPNLGVALSRAIAALSGDQPRRAVIELLSPATNVHEITQVYAFAQSAKKKFDRHGFTSLVLLERDMHSASEITTLHQPFDGVIEIERTRSGDRIVRKIGVLHLKDTAPDPTFRVLEIAESGMRVVREAPKPATPPPTVPSGSVLESQEERARRITLIMQIAGERLKLNPRDTDALFAMAAARATLDDPRGGLRSLDRLSELDPNYPGLWVLKTKLHAHLGDADRARQSRLRAQQIDRSEEAPSGSTVPCPMCEAPVAVDATVCGNCGVKFAPTRNLEDELEDLGHAAIQEIVQEDLQEGVLPMVPRKPLERKLPEPRPRVAPAPKAEEPAPPKPPVRPIPKKGLTNGLVLGRGANHRRGMTNGLRGRTNGLRGRTNGLTNGLGRTNGLTNGVGRTNGLTNGIGRTNGLTNGLGRTNGLTNGLGRTNGITNGLGRTNGITNGLGAGRPSGVRSTGFRGMMRTVGWKLYLIPLVVVGLLLTPLFLVPDYNGPVSPIRIDGQFGDWASVSTAPMGSGALNPNVDVLRFGVVDNLGPQAFFVQVAGTAMQGGGTPPGTMDTVWIFVDTDELASTGYRVDGLGADRLIEVSGYAGIVRLSTLWEFDSNRDPRDWGGWFKGTGTPAGASGSQIEVEADWLGSGTSSIPFAASVHTASWDRQTDEGDFPVSPSEGSLSVVTDPEVPDVITGGDVSLLRLSTTSHRQAVSVDSIMVQIVGTAPPTAALSLRLLDGGTVLDEVVPTGRDVTFSFPAIMIATGSTLTLSIVGDFVATNGDTFGLRLPSGHPFGLGAAAVGLRENPGARALGYLGSVPGSPRVDGGFDEWTALQTDATNDVSPRANANIDLAREGALSGGGSTFLYADVIGRILHGTTVPEIARPTPVQGPPAPADTDRDTVPDSLDPLPLDFNNDGIADANTNGDYDADLIIDYGFFGGTDYWLNTTLPITFPVPYAGLPVSVYIGPTERPPALGEDAFRLFLDIDNSTASGYLIGGIGADRLAEIRGKDGQVTQSALLAFSGSFPGEWSWTPLSPLTVALGYHAVELSVPLSTAMVYAETGDFWGSVDSTAAAPALAPQFTSFKVSPASRPMSLPWQQIGPQSAGTLIDPGSNSATTVYNHQRKVVRAGDVPVDTACDATNSDGCWYAVFYDQVAEATSNTAPRGPIVQNGVATLGAGSASVDVTITSVTTAKSFLVFSMRFDDTEPGESLVSGRIVSSTTLRFERAVSTGAPAITIEWYVAEFLSGVSVQRGTTTMATVTVNVAISSVDTTRSFPIVSYRKSTMVYTADDFIRAKITTSTNLQLSLVDAGAADGVSEWQVIEYTYSSVQSGEISFATTDATKTAAVTAVNTAKAWLLFTNDNSDTTSVDIGQEMVRGIVTNANTLTFDRSNTGQTMTLTWYLVEFTDDTRVQSGSAGFSTTGTQVDVAIPSVDTGKTIATAGAIAYRGGKTPYSANDNPGTATVTLDLTTATNLRLTRTVTGSQTADVGWFVVEFGTVAIGSRVAGTFPTDIQTENGVFVQYRETTDAVEAEIAYRSNTGTNTVSSTKTRTWGGSTWSAETEQATTGSPIRQVRMAWSPTSANTRIIITQSDDGWLDAYVCSPTCTVTNNIGQTWTTVPSTSERRFDIAYEFTSGEALLVHGVLSSVTTQDIAYRTYVGGTWSAEQYLDDTGHATDIQYALINLESRKGSNQIGLIAGDTTNDDANAWVWDGSAFVSFAEITGDAQNPNREQIAIAWESNSGHLLAVAIENTTENLISREFTTSWSAPSTFDCTDSANVNRLSLKPNPLATAGDMVIAVSDDLWDLSTCYWTGSGWATRNIHDADVDNQFTRPMDFAWEDSGSKGLLVWGTTVGQITYRTFTAPNTWGTITSTAMGSLAHPWVQLRTNPFPRPGSTKILGAVMEAATNRDLGAVRWDGTTFTVIGASTFTADVGSTNQDNFELEYHATNDDQLLIRHDWTGVPTGDSHTLQVKGYREDENINVQILTPPSTWNTRITISATSNTMHTYPLTSSEYNSGAPAIRFVDASGSGGMQSDLWIDYANVASNNHWDRVMIMRSLDTSGSTWGAQVILASGRTGDSALLLARDSGEPSIAIDSGGFLHVVWVSASAAGEQDTINLVRYTKTTVAYATQAELASVASWDAVTVVDDTATGFMPTVSVDTSNNPHIAWSGSKTSGTVYYKNKAGGTWRATVSSGTTYTGHSVDVSPQNNYVSLARYFETASWYNSDWQFRKKITIDRTKVSSGPHANFPVLISGTDADLLSKARSDGFDILFTSSDGTTKLNHEREKYTSGTGELVAWVQGPSLSSTVDTDIYMYYGNSGATDQQNATGTWDSNYMGVWHMKEDPSGSAPQIKESSPNANHGTSRGAMTSGDQVAGKIGGALDFDGVNDAIQIPDANSLDVTTITASVWVKKLANAPTWGIIVGRQAGTSFGDLWNLFYNDSPSDEYAWTGVPADGSSTGDVNTWVHLVGIFDGTTSRLYKNGVQVASAAAGGLAAETSSLCIAAGANDATRNCTSEFIQAVVDEVRVSNSARSAGWILTEYNNQNSPSTFYTVGSEANVNEIHYTVCNDLATSNCDTSGEFTKWDGTAGYDVVASSIEGTSYPSLATTYEANGDLWISYAKDVDGSTRAIYARFLDFPSAGWTAAELVDALVGTTLTRPSIGIDRNNEVHVLYVATSGPQVYYNKRTSGSWGTRIAVDTSSDNPTLVVRAPNDATYGTGVGGLYWKTTTSETYFYIPEFDAVVVPIGLTLVMIWGWRRRAGTRRLRGAKESSPSE